MCQLTSPPPLHINRKYTALISIHIVQNALKQEIITVERYFLRNVKINHSEDKKREEGISRYIKHKRKIEFILPRRAAQTPYKKKEKCRYINHFIVTRAHFWISKKKYSGPKHIYNWLTISNWVKGIKNIYYFRNLLCVTICAVKKKL